MFGSASGAAMEDEDVKGADILSNTIHRGHAYE